MNKVALIISAMALISVVSPSLALAQFEVHKPADDAGICVKEGHGDQDECAREQTPAQRKPNNPKPCALKGEMCGGISGILCCPGLTCEYSGDYPDADGVCAEQTSKQP